MKTFFVCFCIFLAMQSFKIFYMFNSGSSKSCIATHEKEFMKAANRAALHFYLIFVNRSKIQAWLCDVRTNLILQGEVYRAVWALIWKAFSCSICQSRNWNLCSPFCTDCSCKLNVEPPVSPELFSRAPQQDLFNFYFLFFTLQLNQSGTWILDVQHFFLLCLSKVEPEHIVSLTGFLCWKSCQSSPKRTSDEWHHSFASWQRNQCSKKTYRHKCTFNGTNVTACDQVQSILGEFSFSLH